MSDPEYNPAIVPHEDFKKVARILREKNLVGKFQCDYCAHESDDIVHLAFRLAEERPEPRYYELHHVKVCISCLYFFKSLMGVPVDKGTF